MNENLNLVEILKDCPKGTKLYSTVYGYVTLVEVQNSGRFPIKYMKRDGIYNSVTAQGLFSLECEGECVLFPSKDQRDWSKFKVKKERFDPKTLQPFDKVLVKNYNSCYWRCAFYSHQRETEESKLYRYATTTGSYICCIPYNDETKHLVGTNEEAPEFYRYWED